MSVVVDDVTRAPVRIVTIANASKGNALTKPMLRALAQAMRDVPSAVRGIVLCADASSANFCTGIDLAAAAEVFATYTRGPRVRAIAGRVEIIGGRWQLVALQIG